jgi:hypothetical protein
MKKLSDKTKKIIGNAFLTLPFGFIAYGKLDEKLPKQNKDSIKISKRKTNLNAIWSSLSIGYLIAGYATGIWTPKQFKEFYKTNKQILIENSIKASHKNALMQIIDSDENGLNRREQYKIDSLMGIQDSLPSYIPTLDDWERAYINRFKKNSIEGK